MFNFKKNHANKPPDDIVSVDNHHDLCKHIENGRVVRNVRVSDGTWIVQTLPLCTLDNIIVGDCCTFHNMPFLETVGNAIIGKQCSFFNLFNLLDFGCAAISKGCYFGGAYSLQKYYPGTPIVRGLADEISYRLRYGNIIYFGSGYVPKSEYAMSLEDFILIEACGMGLKLVDTIGKEASATSIYIRSCPGMAVPNFYEQKKIAELWHEVIYHKDNGEYPSASEMYNLL